MPQPHAEKKPISSSIPLCYKKRKSGTARDEMVVAETLIKKEHWLLSMQKAETEMSSCSCPFGF